MDQRSPSGAMEELRVAVVGEADLGHRGALDRLVDGLATEPGIVAAGRLVPPPRRLVGQALRPAPRLGALELEALRWRLVMSLQARRPLATAARSADVLIVNTQVAALLARGVMARVPTVVSLDCTGRQYDRLEYYRPRRPSDALGERLFETVERRAFAGAALLQAWSDWAARSLVREYGIDERRVVVAHPGIEVDDWPAPERAREPGRRLRLLFVGNDTARKGLPELLRALEGMEREVELDVVSGDPAIDEQDPRMRVHRGLRHGGRLAALFAAADVFAMPSRADVLPWAVLEAMASGLPVVAGDVGAASDLVGGAGLLVPPRDPAAVRAALGALSADPARRRALGAAARARAEGFDVRIQAARLASAVRALHAGALVPHGGSPEAADPRGWST